MPRASVEEKIVTRTVAGQRKNMTFDYSITPKTRDDTRIQDKDQPPATSSLALTLCSFRRTTRMLTTGIPCTFTCYILDDAVSCMLFLKENCRP